MNSPYTLTNVSTVPILAVHNLLSEFQNQQILHAAKTALASADVGLVIDLQGMEVMNSVGLNFLLQLDQHSRQQGGRMVVANVPDQVRSVLQVTRLEDHFELCPSVEAAVEMVHKSEDSDR